MDPIRAYDRSVNRLSRRELLKIAGTVGMAAIARPIAAQQTLARPLFMTYPFSLGVASGDPLPDGVVLWTRLAPDPLNGGGMPATNVEVQWEIAADRAFRTVAQRGAAVARPEVGHSVHVEVAGLQPGREYFYRFRAGDEISQIGRTKTAPAAGSAVDRLRFAVCGCSHYETGYFTAYRRIAEEQFDFVFHTGDYIYEGRGHGGRAPAAVREHQGQEIYTVVDYRNRYAQYKSDPDLLAAHASAPFIVSWDDHEVDNDYAGHLDEQGTPLGAVPAAPGGRVSGVLRDDAAAPPDGADRQHDAPVSAAPVRQPSRLERARHPPVPLEAGLRRGLEAGLPRSDRSRPDDARRRAGEMAVREPGQRAEHVDGARTAGPDLRPRRAEDRPGHPLPDGQVGRVRRRPQPAVCPAERDQGAQPGRSSPATCTSTTAAI